jgi:hypothetical protein
MDYLGDSSQVDSCGTIKYAPRMTPCSWLHTTVILLGLGAPLRTAETVAAATHFAMPPGSPHGLTSETIGRLSSSRRSSTIGAVFKFTLLSGLVFDSLSGHGLSGVGVSLDGLPDKAVTDSMGTFTLSVAVSGRRVVKLTHPLLNLFPERSTRTIELRPGIEYHLFSSTPSPESLARDLCFGQTMRSGLVGRIASKTDAPAQGISVEAAWITGETGTMRRETEATQSDERGFFAFCDLPADRGVTLRQFGGGRVVAERPQLIQNGRFVWLDLALSTEASAVFRGRVLELPTRTPLRGADVVLPDLDRSATSGTNGSFELSKLPEGSHRVLVRLIGYAPLAVRITLGARDTLVTDFPLAHATTVLPELTVRAPARLSPNMSAVEQRRQTTFGRFFLREYLAAREHSNLENVLRTVPGVMLVVRGSAVAAASNRRTLTRVQYERPWPSECYMQIFLNGIRVWSDNGAKSTPYDLNQHSLASLEAVEVYTGADTPPQYGVTGSACGTILLWLREQ